MVSLYNDSRPGSSFLNRSPSIERFGTIFSPRRRPRDVSDARERSQSRRPESGTGSMDITPHPVLRVARRMKKQTSSIWSPHLQHDRRTSRYSIWEPPSAVWSAESGLMGRRNLQVVLFIAGFVLPFGEWNRSLPKKKTPVRLLTLTLSLDGCCLVAAAPSPTARHGRATSKHQPHRPAARGVAPGLSG